MQKLVIARRGLILRIKKKNYTQPEKMFLGIWTFYSFFYLILGSEFGVDYNVSAINTAYVYVTIFLQLSMLFLIKRYQLKEFMKYVAVLAIVFLIEMSNLDRSLLVYALFVMLAQFIDIDKLLRFDIKLKTGMLAIIVGMCALGITENYEAVINGNYKQSWGFSHPNTFTAYILVILVEWLVIRYGKMKWYEWLLIAASALAALQVGGGRSSVYTFVVVFLLFILASVMPKLFYTKPIKLAFTVITPLLAGLSFLAVYLYNRGNRFAYVLNQLMTTRISTASRIINAYGLKLFGQEIEYIGTRTAAANKEVARILDNSYIRCAMDWGILPLIFIVIACSILLRRFLNSRRVELALLGLFFVLLGIGEIYMIRPIYNVSFLCLLGYYGSKEIVGEPGKKRMHKTANAAGKAKVILKGGE